jgi:FlaA1/EpsC-like NDP-sugar epimerase
MTRILAQCSRVLGSGFTPVVRQPHDHRPRASGWTRARRLVARDAQTLGRRIGAAKVPFALDVLALALAFVTAYLLRFDFELRRDAAVAAATQLPYVVLIQMSALWGFGVYRFIWRYVGLAEMAAFLKAAVASALPLVALRVLLPPDVDLLRVPLSVAFVDTVLGFGGVLAMRVTRRSLYEQRRRWGRRPRPDTAPRKPVLLIGAGRAGMLAAREIQRHAAPDLEVRGFVDDDPAKQGTVIQGVRVLGTADDLPRLVPELQIDHVVISIAQASRQQFRRLLDICEGIPIKVRIVPGLHEILQGTVHVSRIRDVQIEDLLGRDAVQLDERGISRMLSGRTALVTGAGGSIGSELVRQVARFGPRQLLLVERAEFALFTIEREIRQAFPSLDAVPILADIADRGRMSAVLRIHRPQVLLHAAAHKHVPMMEFNPGEAIRNNALATHQLGELAAEFGLDAFVLISTDKAVRPTSVMGASKRLAELFVQTLSRQHQTRFVTVRFGNVIGSTGSVIPIFRDQIRRGGPVTVTHPDMKRYFMTIPEAAQLVLQAAAIGEAGDVMILDMGEPVRILDLARATIALSGLKPFEDIDIVFTGPRPGEKLFEELNLGTEQIAKTRHPKIFTGRTIVYPHARIQDALRMLHLLCRDGQEPELYAYLTRLLPEARLTLPESLRRAEPAS